MQVCLVVTFADSLVVRIGDGRGVRLVGHVAAGVAGRVALLGIAGKSAEGRGEQQLGLEGGGGGAGHNVLAPIEVGVRSIEKAKGTRPGQLEGAAREVELFFFQVRAAGEEAAAARDQIGPGRAAMVLGAFPLPDIVVGHEAHHFFAAFSAHDGPIADAP
ncbi:hypothetical protein BpHYR1_037025 [Brachionus plicatilis]|uniref:Uncharacterized protein n=1 Tax=Brachionus plicatilis TaxID=10195 RepID=A0A3M7SMG1_BRAPC|nr:hypothetical protein BpHYR1_037025 [Brachionus plicatilis]